MNEIIIDDRAHGVRVVKLDLEPLIAPCRSDGQVTTVDDDNKGAICRCPLRTCWVDGRNHVLVEADEQYRVEYVN